MPKSPTCVYILCSRPGFDETLVYLALTTILNRVEKGTSKEIQQWMQVYPVILKVFPCYTCFLFYPVWCCSACKENNSTVFSCRTTKIATSNDWNSITSKKPGTILSMQNVDGVDGAGSNREPLGQTKVMKIHQGAITHEICCLAAQWFLHWTYSHLAWRLLEGCLLSFCI